MKLRYRPTLTRRLISLLLAVCVVTFTPLSVAARTTEEVEAEQKELEAQRDQLEAKLEQLRSDEAQKQEYQATLQQEIDVLEAQISTARRDIDELNANITLLNEKLEKAAAESADTLDQFKQRVVAIYRAGSVSTLEVLLNSSSFSDFSMRSEMLTNLSRHDQELMDKISVYIESTRVDREEREKQKALVAEQKKKLEQNQKELDALYEENAAAIAELQGAQGATSTALRQTQEDIDAHEAELKQLLEEEKRRREEEEKRRKEEAAAAAANNGASANPISAGGQGDVTFTGEGSNGFRPCWPLPGVTYISDEYGGYRGHRGMDIAGVFGTAIVAAESGKVLRAWTQDTWGMGWGYHVYIYHNDTYCTLYAHMSSVAVSEGQYVTQGQIIGYEGSTGDSTGPHLHFEVWQNGTRVNPRNFLF